MPDDNINMKNKSEPLQEQVELKGPTESDICFTFVAAFIILITGWLTLKYLIIPSWLTPATCIFLMVLFLLFSLYYANKKKSGEIVSGNGFRNWYADFGLRLWHFPGLWYVVFLVGVYVAGIAALIQYADQTSSVDPSKILLPLMQNIIIAAFLAVLTSVLANTFASVGELPAKINAANDKSREAYELIKGSAEKIDTMSKEIRLLENSISIGISAKLTANRIYKITNAAQELEQKKIMIPMAQSVVKMCEEVEKYHLMTLNPLLAPGIKPPKDRDVVDTVTQISERLGNHPDEAPHYAYMSAAIGRYFGSEIIERQFPGVLLHVTSFSYYIQTINRIVCALEQWHKGLEFYTLMPKTPTLLFRFCNSQDIYEWRNFLKAYYNFSTNQVGLWKRYFAYTTMDDLIKRGFVLKKEIEDSVRYSYVVTEETASWLPRIIKAEDIDKYIPKECNQNIIDSIKRQCEFHDGMGTLSAYCNLELSAKMADWRKLKDVLLEYHGLDANAEDGEIKKKFVYRCIDDCDCMFKDSNSIEIYSCPSGTYNEGEKGVDRSFRMPTDFFAIRDSKTFKWLFFIGLDAEINKNNSDRQLAFAPVLDLATMAHPNSGPKNNAAATKVSEYLEKVFIKIDENNTISHNKICIG